MPLDLENDTTLNDALAKLEAAEAGQEAPPSEAFVQADADAQQPEQASGEAAKLPKDGTESDTPAEVEPKPPAAGSDKSEAQGKDGKPETTGTKFAKDQQRRDTSWKALNQEKEAFKSERQKLEQERQAFQREQQEYQQKQARRQQQHTPEEYETASVRTAKQGEQLDLQAKGLEAQATELEDAGKYSEAETAKAKAKELREQAAYQRGVARELKQHAEQVRKNPDPTLEQLKQRNAAQLRDYTLAAAKEWPDLVKDGSEFQKQVVKNIQEARAAGLDENEFPIVRYHCARMAALESTSARVPGLEKALGAANARVKELEALTNPGGGEGAVQSAGGGKGAVSDEDEGAELRAMAMQR